MFFVFFSTVTSEYERCELRRFGKKNIARFIDEQSKLSSADTASTVALHLASKAKILAMLKGRKLECTEADIWGYGLGVGLNGRRGGISSEASLHVNTEVLAD